MYKTVRVYLLKNLSNNKIDIFNKPPTSFDSSYSFRVLECDLAIQYYNQNPSILDIRRTMDRLKLTISDYPSRLRLSSLGNEVFSRTTMILSYQQSYKLTESIKAAVIYFGYSERLVKIVYNSSGFNLSSMVDFSYKEIRDFVRKILITEGLKVHD